MKPQSFTAPPARPKTQISQAPKKTSNLPQFPPAMVTLGAAAESAALALVGALLDTNALFSAPAFEVIEKLPTLLDDLSERPRIALEILRTFGPMDAAQLIERAHERGLDACRIRLGSFAAKAMDSPTIDPSRSVATIVQYLRFCECWRRAHRLLIALESGQYDRAVEIHGALGPWLVKMTEGANNG